MKKTFLLVSIAAFSSLVMQQPASCQQKVKYTTENTDLFEVQQSRNGWSQGDRVLIKSPPPNSSIQSPAKTYQRVGASPAGAGQVSSSARIGASGSSSARIGAPVRSPAGVGTMSPDLPVVRAPRAHGYLLNRGSSKTRKQAISGDGMIPSGSSVSARSVGIPNASSRNASGLNERSMRDEADSGNANAQYANGNAQKANSNSNTKAQTNAKANVSASAKTKARPNPSSTTETTLVIVRPGATRPGAIKAPIMPNTNVRRSEIARMNEVRANQTRRMQIAKPAPPSTNSQAAPYAASYGDYDPKAKKKRNY